MIAYGGYCRCKGNSTSAYATTTSTNSTTASNCPECGKWETPTAYVVTFATTAEEPYADEYAEKPKPTEPTEPREPPACERLSNEPCERVAHSVPSWPPQLARPPPVDHSNFLAAAREHLEKGK